MDNAESSEADIAGAVAELPDSEEDFVGDSVENVEGLAVNVDTAEEAVDGLKVDD